MFNFLISFYLFFAFLSLISTKLSYYVLFLNMRIVDVYMRIAAAFCAKFVIFCPLVNSVLWTVLQDLYCYVFIFRQRKICFALPHFAVANILHLLTAIISAD